MNEGANDLMSVGFYFFAWLLKTADRFRVECDAADDRDD